MVNKQAQISLLDEIIVDNFAGGGGASTGIELATMRGNLGNIGHNIMIGWERGEEAPTC